MKIKRRVGAIDKLPDAKNTEEEGEGREIFICYEEIAFYFVLERLFMKEEGSL